MYRMKFTALCGLEQHNMAEAPIREILGNAVQPEGRVKLGSLLARIGSKINLTGEEFSIFDQSRVTCTPV